MSLWLMLIRVIYCLISTESDPHSFILSLHCILFFYWNKNNELSTLTYDFSGCCKYTIKWKISLIKILNHLYIIFVSWSKCQLNETHSISFLWWFYLNKYMHINLQIYIKYINTINKYLWSFSVRGVQYLWLHVKISFFEIW